MGLFDLFSRSPSKGQFARMIMKVLHEVGDRRVASYDEEGFRLTFSEDGGEKGTI